LQHALWVGAGGFLGSVARYLLGSGAHRLFGDPWMPLGTWTVNVAGCFAIGLLAALAETTGPLSSSARLFVFTGFLGGFTTFSAFAYESLKLAGDIHAGAAFGNVVGQVALGLLAVWAGVALGRAL
jgi:CrcB protein